MPKFSYVDKAAFYIFDLYLIPYVCNPGKKRGIQIALFGYIFRFEWRRDIFREMFAERAERGRDAWFARWAELTGGDRAALGSKYRQRPTEAD